MTPQEERRNASSHAARPSESTASPFSERTKWKEYRAHGYTMCVADRNGNLVPGYSDWILEHALDLLELESAYDDLGQCYRIGDLNDATALD